ncbi:UbiA family prenyltransferase [Segeticoccus rhizosphaerae]|uniref:UbiA family prenyltransferase n=1 Tax=Segeticoccus rhizosphaerae TaxID=1104777 RepID=UPI0010C0D272|nr:UbiA family prenyltransferase [Ornithinicoccus soli]
MPWAKTTVALARACHPGPTLAVTALAGVFAAGSGLGAARCAVLLLAVGSGQLVIGWTNDLVDAGRDRLVGRTDKPLVTGELEAHLVRRALGVAAGVTVVASLACGPWAGLLHVFLVVGSGLAYDLRLKRTGWSFLPYLVAFGTLPAVVTWTLPQPAWPAWWVMAASGLLGVGAHLVNVLPDLAADAATGVAGLPHRLGGPRVRALTPVVLCAATALLLLAPPGPPSALGLASGAVVLLLALVSIRGGGKTPFYGAIAIAAVDVVMLVLLVTAEQR